VVDDKRNELPEGCVGEIAITGDCLFSGYFRLPDETNKVLQDSWYYSGDLGFMHKGELYISGRKKDLIIVHGKNYYTHDIEYVANKAGGFKPGRAVAIGVYFDNVGSEEVILIAETEETGLEKLKQAKRVIKMRISKELNLVIKDVHLVPLKWLIKTTSGKISRKENKEKYMKENGISET
jgi:fatty-acyl-CoA synthase